MGTDIHFYVERKEGGSWRSCDAWGPDEYSDDVEKPLTVPFGGHFYEDRCYDLFAILANVRNGFGFAGVPTSAGFNYIAEARGLPIDMSPELAGEAKRNLDHTPSWLTLAEILAFDWTQKVTKQAWVAAPAYFLWWESDRKRGDGPKSYCGSIDGPGIKHVSELELKQMIADVAPLGANWQERKAAVDLKLKGTYCPIEWGSTYSHRCPSFWSDCVPRLLQLGRPEDVRIVFWFDS